MRFQPGTPVCKPGIADGEGLVEGKMACRSYGCPGIFKSIIGKTCLHSTGHESGLQFIQDRNLMLADSLPQSVSLSMRETANPLNYFIICS